MAFFLGGTPSSGKTTTAERFLAEEGVPFPPLEYLIIGVANGLPEAEVNPRDALELQDERPERATYALEYVEVS